MTRSLLLGLAAGLTLTLLVWATSAFTNASLGAALPAILALALMVAIMHRWKTQLFETLRENNQQAGTRLALMADQIAETQGLVQLTRFNDAYPMPFGGGWALTADAAVVLVREIALHQPRVIVELGSGVSTLLIGRMLKEAGAGKLYSLDHDAHWAELTRHNVRASGLDSFVEVLDAPLAKQSFNGREFNWYQVPEALRQVRDIDLIIVDGPPQSLDPSGTPRYPALPAFLAQLSPKAVIYIDDAKRAQEQEMLAQWHKDFPGFESRMIDTVPGTCLFRRKA
jgi:predicted O-methyltransferase YrrM